MIAIVHAETDRAAYELERRMHRAATPLAALTEWIRFFLSLSFEPRRRRRVNVLDSPEITRASGYSAAMTVCHSGPAPRPPRPRSPRRGGERILPPHRAGPRCPDDPRHSHDTGTVASPRIHTRRFRHNSFRHPRFRAQSNRLQRLIGLWQRPWRAGSRNIRDVYVEGPYMFSGLTDSLRTRHRSGFQRVRQVDLDGGRQATVDE
jgi:hypothetical protein